MSDDDVTLGELKSVVEKFCDERGWRQFHTPKEVAIGIVTEASELLERLRFKSDEQIEELLSGQMRAGIEEELSDSLYFILRFAQVTGIDLSEAFDRKMKANAAKYPVAEAYGRNRKYDERSDVGNVPVPSNELVLNLQRIDLRPHAIDRRTGDPAYL